METLKTSYIIHMTYSSRRVCMTQSRVQCSQCCLQTVLICLQLVENVVQLTDQTSCHRNIVSTCVLATEISSSCYLALSKKKKKKSDLSACHVLNLFSFSRTSFVRIHISLDTSSTTLDATTEQRICSCFGGNNNGVIETDYNTVLKPLATVCKALHENYILRKE